MKDKIDYTGDEQAEKTCGYIRMRRCKSGGYCFYRLDHPNAADTFYALHSLLLLGKDLYDEQTREFLKSLQKEDGSYSSVQAALYCGYSLALLGDRPLIDIEPYLDKINLIPSKKYDKPDNRSFLEPAYNAIALYRLYGKNIPGDAADLIGDAIFGLKESHYEGRTSFGNLTDTQYSVMILKMLGYKLPTDEIKAYINDCTDREYGFVPEPGRAPAYLENIYSGLILSLILKTKSNSGLCRNFINMCYDSSGGYVRSVFGGSPSLEYTRLAIESLYMLETGMIPDIYQKKASYEVVA
jgi:hypothetical protein